MKVISYFLTISCLLFCSNARSQSLNFEASAEGILVKEGTKKVLFFQKEIKSLNGKYPRANYIHPLYDIEGHILTEDFPEDHLHHRGIFWTWHQILVDGMSIGDGWECKDISWDVTDVRATIENDESLRLYTNVFWNTSAYKEGDSNFPFLHEKTEIKIYPSEENYRIIDFEISLLALVNHLKIGGSDDIKGYGGFSVRLKLPEDISFSSEEINIPPTNEALIAKRWMDINGSFNENKKSGVIIIASKENPTPNNKWILRSKKSMQNAVYPGNIPVKISKENPTILKYRMILYKNKISSSLLNHFYQF
ncbi:hypothetical protein JoomaDRAFT_2426 [Galbibacter orientalis DSM 19592]|uniref:Methane oxygenase PmoA n=1 Tax=Galbibacter orientalis DSM 19592 TaxID=926559 RepID=I3C712_9FLAO|nr:DUF6807 family protein [Galbibacter orientalis]EIJ39405.1 hypothetical protein JoomaDRAFT_2426 [Galbibacter orientalis DSM 19592]